MIQGRFPNLDFKIEVGNSLAAPNPSGGLELGFRKSLVDDYLKTKAGLYDRPWQRESGIA